MADPKSQTRARADRSPISHDDDAVTLEPDVPALVELLRNAVENRDEAVRRGRAGAERARTSWSWERAAEIVEARLSTLIERTAIPSTRRHERYSDAMQYAERIYSAGELDGIVLELFKRLRIDRPSFVEMTDPTAPNTPARLLRDGLGWREVNPPDADSGFDLFALGNPDSLKAMAADRNAIVRARSRVPEMRERHSSKRPHGPAIPASPLSACAVTRSSFATICLKWPASICVAGSVLNAKQRLRVYWKGAFYTSASLAIVNRRLVRALIERGNVDISIGTDPLANGSTVAPEFRALSERTTFGADEADVTVLHEWPPRFAAPSSTRYVHVQPWEYGSMPTAWFEALHDDCDEIWVHSEYNRAAYIEAGIDPARIAVIPHGFDPRIFNPDGPKMAVADDRFRFLFVGGTVPRKGIDVLVNAYTAAFGPYDNVSLVIKDADASFYRNQTRSQELRALAARRDIPRIEYIDQTVPDEAMAQIFRGCDTFVLPYRGEGFGLPVLEAMACGLAPIVTFGGATDDLVDTRGRMAHSQHAR